MRDLVRVAGVQMSIELLKPEVNLQKHQQFVKIISESSRADLVVFPELASSGYLDGMEQEDFDEFSLQYYRAAQKIPGPYTDSLVELSRTYNAYLVTGILEADPSIPGVLYNSAVLISPVKGVMGVYRKIQIIKEEKHYFRGGSNIEVYPTELGNIGIIICADNAFPELPRLLALKGAEIICVPYARVAGIGNDPNLYYSLPSCRAYENNCFLIACNRVGIERGKNFEGKSCICGPGGEFLARSENNSEEVLKAELSGESMVQARLRYSRFRDRCPKLYQELYRSVEGEIL